MASSEQSTELMTRKEKRYQEREAQILRVARSLLQEHGFAELTMDRIADAINYSKPVVYQHFPCKEEIVLALALQTALIRLKLFERVGRFAARPRERVIAHGEATVLLLDHLQCEMLVGTNALGSKTSEARQDLYQRALRRMMGAGGLIVEEAVAEGDLTLPEDLNSQAFAFGLWTAVFGGFAILSVGTNLIDPITSSGGRGTPEDARLVRMCARALLDAYGWRPLSTEWDYRETMRRIYTEVFPPEVIEEVLAEGDTLEF